MQCRNVFVVSFFYVLVASVVFVLPALVPTFDEVVVKLTTAMLFLIGPLSNLINLAAVIAQSNCAVDNIDALESQLKQTLDDTPEAERRPIAKGRDFERLQLTDVAFEYRTDHAEMGAVFRVGPITASFKSGEIVFITGGNGSGKSTFMKLLAALYHPSSGQVVFNDKPVTPANVQSYRERISAIFSDFHLFAKFYGLRDVAPSAVDDLLVRLKIADKTAYENGRFTNMDLSTGQRKRLALLISYLEDREIYLFDEWAADQDPVFKKYFYEVLLRDLKSRKKTVIAVTHDDNYHYAADRLLRMDYGKFVQDSPKKPADEV